MITLTTQTPTIQQINQFDIKTVIELMNSLRKFTPNPPQVYPKPNSLWLDIDSETYIKSLPESVYCVDFETIKDTKVLVMGSAYDLMNSKWYVWLSIPENNDKVSISGKSIIIAHRSTFELGFIWESYDLDCQLRFFDTHVMACQRYHPGNIPLYRAAPKAPIFAESCDLSLKELAEKLCGIRMDKDIVEVFINAQDESWRESHFEINPVFKSSLKKFKKISYENKKLTKDQEKRYKNLTEQQINLLVEKKKKVEIFDYYTEKWIKENCPNGSIEHLCSCDFLSILTSKKKKEATWVWRNTPEIEQLFNYNYKDVCATIAIFWNMWPWYSKLAEPYIGGLYQRSIPFLPLSIEWFSEIDKIESVYFEKIQLMTDLVDKIENEYEKMILERNSDSESEEELKSFDFFDWNRWTKKTPKKDGILRWKGETGLSSKKLMRLSRLSWKGLPMFIKSIDKTDSEGNFIRLTDNSISQKLTWYVCDNVGNWIDSVKLCQNPRPLDNPTNTSGEFKDIVTVFSKKFIEYWESGDIKSESIYARQIAEIYASISFWNSFRERIITKLPVVKRHNNNQTYLAALLRPLVAGTLTNRAIDYIGLVISKATYGKIGSEIGGHFTTPEGWSFVFADFDAIQARITALYQAVAVGRNQDLYSEFNHKLYSCVNNEYSQSVLTGNKTDKTNTAWLIAKKAGWWLPEDQEIVNNLKLTENPDPAQVKYYKDKADKAYSNGKNANYAMLFGAGADKLGLMLGNYEIAVALIEYFKGVRNKATWLWEGGIASDYYNFSEELANGLYQEKDRFYKTNEIYSAFLKCEMSAVLKPSNRKREMAGTAQNATVQRIDVDALCYQTYYTLQRLNELNIPVRYSTTVHDALFVLVPNEYTEETTKVFQEIHENLYVELFKALNLDPLTAPDGLFQYEGVDICTRWVKSTGDLGKTLSNLDGYDYELSATMSYDDEGSCILKVDDFEKSSVLRKKAREILRNQDVDN